MIESQGVARSQKTNKQTKKTATKMKTTQEGIPTILRDMKIARGMLSEFSFEEAHSFINLVSHSILCLSSRRFKAETRCVRKIIRLKKKVTNMVFP